MNIVFYKPEHCKEIEDYLVTSIGEFEECLRCFEEHIQFLKETVGDQSSQLLTKDDTET